MNVLKFFIAYLLIKISVIATSRYLEAKNIESIYLLDEVVAIGAKIIVGL